MKGMQAALSAVVLVAALPTTGQDGSSTGGTHPYQQASAQTLISFVRDFFRDFSRRPARDDWLYQYGKDEGILLRPLLSHYSVNYSEAKNLRVDFSPDGCEMLIEESGIKHRIEGEFRYRPPTHREAYESVARVPLGVLREDQIRLQVLDDREMMNTFSAPSTSQPNVMRIDRTVGVRLVCLSSNACISQALTSRSSVASLSLPFWRIDGLANDKAHQVVDYIYAFLESSSPEQDVARALRDLAKRCGAPSRPRSPYGK